MKFSLAAPAAMFAVLAAACGGESEDKAAAETVDAEAPAAVADAARSADVAAAPSPAPLPAAEGAPAFAVLYPGGQIAPPVAGAEPAPDQTAFVTAASPEDVVAFYREKAEAAGLSPVMAMSQETVEAFGALSPATGESLEVVAEALDGQTRVTLSWAGERAG